MQRLVMISSEDLASIEDLIAAADGVCETWEGNQLARRVNALQEQVALTKFQLGMDTRPECPVVCKFHDLTRCVLTEPHDKHSHPITGLGHGARHDFLDVTIIRPERQVPARN